jgi:hypothetical protein
MPEVAPAAAATQFQHPLAGRNQEAHELVVVFVIGSVEFSPTVEFVDIGLVMITQITLALTGKLQRSSGVGSLQIHEKLQAKIPERFRKGGCHPGMPSAAPYYPLRSPVAMNRACDWRRAAASLPPLSPKQANLRSFLALFRKRCRPCRRECLRSGNAPASGPEGRLRSWRRVRVKLAQ